MKKYVLYSLVTFFALVLAGQLLAQLFTLKQLLKITGTIAGKQVAITSYRAGPRFTRGEPVYSLLITLNNGRHYNIELDDTWRANEYLHIGDEVTLHYPTKIFQVLSLDGLDSESYAIQVQSGNKMITSFQNHQQKAWPFISYIIIAILLFIYLLRDSYRNA